MRVLASCLTFLFTSLGISISQTQSLILLQDIDEIRHIALSPDETKLALSGVVNDQSGIWLYNIATQTIEGIPTDAKAASISWSPDGTKIAGDTGTGDFVTYQIFDTATYTLLITFEQPAPVTDDISVTWSTDGTKVMTQQSSVIYIRDSNNGTPLTSIVLPSDLLVYSINSTAWDSVAGRIYSLVGSDQRILVWDSNTGNLLQEFLLDSYSQNLTISPDNTKLAIANTDGQILILDATSGIIVKTLGDSENEFANAISWRSNNIHIATRGGDLIKVWDITTGKRTHTIPAVRSFTWNMNPLGLILATFRNDVVENVKFIEFPSANAGSSQIIADIDDNGEESIALDGSASSDSDGIIVSYSWSINDVEIATGTNPQITLPVGEHTITLTVTDDDGVTAVDDVKITIT